MSGEEFVTLERFSRELEQLQRSQCLSKVPLAAHARKVLAGEQEAHLSLKTEINALSGVIALRLWETMSSWISQNNPSAGLSTLQNGTLTPFLEEDLRAEISALFDRDFHFPCSRLRSYAAKLADHFVKTHISVRGAPLLAAGDPALSEIFDRYRMLLRRTRTYWFRRSPAEHIGTGLHTAISANFKMIEMVPFVFQRAGEQALTDGDGWTRDQCLKVLRSEAQMSRYLKGAMDMLAYVASSHFEVLNGVEGVCWDKTASIPANFFKVTFESGTPVLAISKRSMDETARRLDGYQNAEGFEERTGCPALGVRLSGAGTLVKEVGKWCESIGARFFYSAIARKYACSSTFSGDECENKPVP